ncbi:hypothetical protein RvY_06309-4 [Ramazzottius varieornatus]|uniref:Histone deacetylase domain-containing protein n=1 Tax=Ramazzottius varieornatus TaxID=947166 RepID=A0A1D1UY45_RAMVA|nr:hypothetical protein RvY_06309-4 [Ramazzottius varieornatus]
MAAISIHRYVNGRFWPHLPESNFDRSGECQGKGYNVNIALSGRGLGDADCLAIFQQIILPVGRRLWSIRKAIQVIASGTTISFLVGLVRPGICLGVCRVRFSY